MEKLSEMIKGILEKLKNMSMLKKIAFSVLFFGAIISAILFGNYFTESKYGVLFSNLPAEDAQMVTGKLKEMKVQMKIKGTAIYVPKEAVDELRLELAPSMSNGSKGYELLDSGNQFGMTDEEFKIKKQRITQGELEKTIKSFPQIENARVHVTPAQDSVFVKDSKPGRAAVYLQLKAGNKLSVDQVKAIVALISGSVENIPKENVEVIDDKMKLLSKGIFDENNNQFNTPLEKIQAIETDFEAKLENALKDLLEPAIGKNKVKIKVNADMDFDSKEKTQISYDPNKVEISTHSIKENSNSPGDKIAESPIDNNMNNITTAPGSGNSTSTREEQTNNYNVGKTETRTISAPGEIKRITASVIINGKLDEATKSDIQKAVATAIGFKADRGDEVSILGMAFDPTEADDSKKLFEDMEKEAEEAKKMALYKNIAVGAAGLIGFILLLVILRRSSKKKEKSKQESTIDVVISENLQPKERIEYAPLDFEAHDGKSHIEKEIKKYASDKPDQVADIIRSWLAEDER
jgi:flagellar M-ring protein FliF